ncbi:uncharacterized protein LOC108116522 [Drosophila eugracilis]|uniref:uncharacterized protein LOC108116522 n=1 Tax=Drosophila eugracilis TaxID=29029 RepID=UPI001BD95DE9|nr:uncharacterized protein LOC108116522 [Drosophila eugracilis]
MLYLNILGILLLFVAASVSAFDRELANKRFCEFDKEENRLIRLPNPNQRLHPEPCWRCSWLMNLFRPPPQGKIFDLKEYFRVNRQAFTPFERRVIRLLRELGLVKSEAEKLIDTLEKDKELARRLKRLLDKVDEQHETEDFLEEFFNLFSWRKL